MFDKRKYDYEWTKKNLKRISLNVHHEEYERIMAHVTSRNENLTAFIKRAIFSQIERDTKE